MVRHSISLSAVIHIGASCLVCNCNVSVTLATVVIAVVLAVVEIDVIVVKVLVDEAVLCRIELTTHKSALLIEQHISCI